MYPYIHWSEKLLNQDGVMTGADRQQEWMLPWWWDCYQQFNAYPVVFADFGMSEEACAWCRERGEVIPVEFPEGSFVPKSNIPPERITLWEKVYRAERLWNSRKVWFMKPLAMLMSPFSRTIWIDLDCEVKGSLKDVFPSCEHKEGVSMVPEPVPSVEKQLQLGLLKPGQRLYNSGVVAYKKGALPILEWARRALEKNGEYPGNQTLLADLLQEKKWDVDDLDPRYNWRMMLGPNPQAVIIHWVSTGGKEWIRQQLRKNK